jgi:hypothetical protein
MPCQILAANFLPSARARYCVIIHWQAWDGPRLTNYFAPNQAAPKPHGCDNILVRLALAQNQTWLSCFPGYLSCNLGSTLLFAGFTKLQSSHHLA